MYINVYRHIYIHREKKGKQKRMCVTKAKIICFSGLHNGNYRNILYRALSKYLLSLINVLTVCFL